MDVSVQDAPQTSGFACQGRLQQFVLGKTSQTRNYARLLSPDGNMRYRRTMRSRQFMLLVGLVSLVGLFLYFLHGSSNPAPGAASPPPPQWAPKHEQAPLVENESLIGEHHPIQKLIDNADKSFTSQLGRQSKTLGEAITEYRRRYGIPPPPNFDKWYEFAKEKNVQIIDDYDSIHRSLTPFWGLKPATIRARAKEAQGFNNNNLLSLLIRNGAVATVDGGSDWQKEATEGMMKGFVRYLPDVDLCFNIHDEPRVVVPYDDLSRLVKTAQTLRMPAANAVVSPRNSWSPPKGDVYGTDIKEVKTTRFNVFAHQPTWTHSRMSCPPESPARALEDGVKQDDLGSYSIGELGFVYNTTAFSDVCNSPSFSETFGFFDRPNAFNIVHDLFPIFSQSKISSFSDILYPSPWYWYGKVAYQESKDMVWEKKQDKFYWRGSTTGGFSRDGGWRRQHRQRVVQKINSVGQAKILINRGEDKEDWQVKEVPRSDYKDIFDIFFSMVGQCDPQDCDAQKQFFTIKKQVKQQDAWKYKYLLDIDGNAFSGRFYAFLKSRSLVYKLAVFREWHEEWLKPWVHYIPLSLRGDEWVEAIRWFAGETKGKEGAQRIALQGREWSDKVLRNEDLEAWFFRLLLEYGRVVDDDREIIGFSP
ncbi:glycosyltransferase family 90 protein [Calycina marina]|uniref:Glycosyltransferase family 90 protein n=1 Tax=Calycina marina TaxID=1763456 RepID=A0A9P8CHC0_9HELO|nr:glycosyltransferase family 90 protein [Calycina marina]